MKRKIILFYSQVIWDDVWQRPQEFATGSSEYTDIVYYAPVPWHRYFQVHKKNFAPVKQINKHLSVYSPRILPGHYRCPLVKKINEQYLFRHIKQLHKENKFDIFMTNSPFVRYLLPLFKDIPVIYDVIDDFIRFSWAPSNGEKEEQDLFKMASLCFTGTHTLYERKKPFHKDIYFIPCGVHFDKFYQPLGECPGELKDVPRPIIGYFGTLSDRLDKVLIKKISDKFPDASLVFIGPIQTSFGTPVQSSNIYYTGLKPHDVLPFYLREFSVCILPFAMDEGTKSINPVKLLEFLSGGKIVISTPIPDIVRFYEGVVYLADRAEEFLDIIEKQIKNPDRERINKGIDLARSNSWNRMVEEMLKHCGFL